RSGRLRPRQCVASGSRGQNARLSPPVRTRRSSGGAPLPGASRPSFWGYSTRPAVAPAPIVAAPESLTEGLPVEADRRGKRGDDNCDAQFDVSERVRSRAQEGANKRDRHRDDGQGGESAEDPARAAFTAGRRLLDPAFRDPLQNFALALDGGHQCVELLNVGDDFPEVDFVTAETGQRAVEACSCLHYSHVVAEHLVRVSLKLC